MLAELNKQHKVQYFLGRLEERPAKEKTGKKLLQWLKALPERDGVSLSAALIGELETIAQSASAPVWVEKAVDVMIAVDRVKMA